jgi:serine/threonine-protein kinase
MGDRLDKRRETPTPLSASVGSIPPQLLHEASRRLGWAGLVYSGTFLLAYFGSYLIFGDDPGSAYGEMGLFGGRMAVQTTVAIIAIVVGLGVFALAHHTTIAPQRLLDIGLVFEVVGAFGISMSTYWGIFPEWGGIFFYEYAGIPWECVWIIVFPLLAPNTPRKIAVASFAAASTGLLVVLLSQAAGLTSREMPLYYFGGYFLLTSYVCALLAIVISRVVYDFGRRMGRAMEVGSYQLLRPLGKGGMGEVWLARHCMLARPAAVKLIRPEALGSDGGTAQTALRRFEREARATAAMDSFHTITIFDFGVSQEGAFYYVMELLKGLNLDELVRRFGPIPPERAVHLMRQVCHSLGEAHGCGLIHRDIKPANIFTCRLGPEYDFVKVLDFGLVKPSGEAGAAATELTVEGVATGTPAFMAPEMALGQTDIDGRADIYALGCVGYWLLTGQKVFDAQSALAVAVAHVQETPVPPSKRTELEISDALEQVILGCLEKDPSRRPQSAGELDAQLAGSLEGSTWTRERAREWWQLHLPDSQLAGCQEVTEGTRATAVLAVRGR